MLRKTNRSSKNSINVHPCILQENILLLLKQPNFVLCIGGSRNNTNAAMASCEESMFSTFYGHDIDRNPLFTISHEPKKCTMANWYLQSSND